ncbi:uncharacterized protein LOC127857684 isoform X2 [Dreissena polymorpha]|uniref:USP domain-containing protein n=5 Tax=Dreissena polymorpha TaxID=45954 RepID=A0A9D3Z2B9_DREPO|nr:uncharacterized protein LOC127857684 isoform X1 [Dreissena polymorpha]XP_052250253.1 uncharacterized protein LOC127857684 isoform X1 [Dreissena polymorpha]XP_052250254.1 uncharacterized protein LOC127857684 isoform X1 [Dreissena polymorpha]XP_052250255.1 uncharacterized protein LOC127857684 isoform X2 [Dreissena polymorpha]KAH3709360.1 hypothetical protein DPMN_068822 [Dreissena polymorpha]
MLEGKTCPLCDRLGQRSLLKSYQINLEEAVTICANEKCTYPLSDSLYGLTFSRQVSEVQASRQSVLTVPASQLELQSRAAARMKKLGVQLQNHGKGNQTGSPQVDKISSAYKKSLISRDTIQSVSNNINSLPYQTIQSIGDHTVPSVVQTSQETLHAKVDIYQEEAKREYWRKRHGSTESLNDDSMNSNSDYIDSCSDRGSTDGKVHLVQNVFPFSCSPENACSSNLLEALCTESVTETTHLELSKFNVQVQEQFKTNLPIKLTKSTAKLSCYPKQFVQWRNKDNLCWLDVVLCLCVHNVTLKRQVTFDTDCLIYKLLKAHNQAQSLLSKSSCDGNQDLANHSYRQLANTVRGINDNENKSLLKENESAFKKKEVLFDNSEIENILNGVREEVWQFLQTKLRCSRGQHESPVFAFPLFLRQSPELSDVFKMKYSFEYKCSCCEYTESHSFENLLPTFPELVDNFSISSPSHKKKCPECGNSEDVRTMVYKDIPDALLMHFTSGLPSMPLSDLQLNHHGNTYAVTGLVQYQEGTDVPNHFVAWLRNPDDNMWMKCDDLDGSVCAFNHSQPSVPSSQVHIVMWEKVIPKTRTCRQLTMVPDHDNSISFHDDVKNLLKTDNCGVDDRNPDEANFSQRKGTKMTLYEPFKFGGTRNLAQGSQSSDAYKSSDPEQTSGGRVSLVKQFVDVNHKQDFMDSDSGLSSMCNEPVRITKRRKPDRRDLSPCSVASTESSESVHLPKFVDLTPVTSSVQRPIPCRSKMSLMSINQNSGLNIETSKSSVLKEQAYVGNIHVSRLETRVDSETKVNSEKAHQDVCDSANSMSLEPGFDLPSVVVVPCTKLNGIVSSINPSTVFCKPIKTLPETVPSGPLPEKCIEIQSSVTTAREGSLPQRNEIDLMQPESQVITKISKPLTVQVPSESIRRSYNSTPKSGSASSQSSRFKLPPFSGLNKKKTTIDRNAFYTLEKQKVANQENVKLNEASSLSQVKQYLLTRTAGTARTKFEGLNLKSNVDSSSCCPVLSQSHEQLASSINMHNTSANSENNSSQNGVNMRSAMSSILTKRKSFSNMSDFHHVDNKKPREETSTNNETNSLKENFPNKKNYSQIRKQTVKPGYTGKNKSMVDKWATDSMNITGHSDTPEFLRNSFVPTATEKDLMVGSDTVLQDLYDALNIPYNHVQDTMTSIMSDVDDILQFVDANDAFRDDMRATSPESCRSIPVFKEHFKTDCMVRIPGRNSA